jgi:hypothetical protein
VHIVAYVGSLRQYYLGEILRILGDGLRRGRLVVERGGLRADLYCENGYIVSVWRSGPFPSLAQRWVASGLLFTEQLEQIARVTGYDPTEMPDAQLANLCLEQQIITIERLTEWAQQDVVDLLSILFSWRDGDYRFEEGLTAPPTRLRVPLTIPMVLNAVVQSGAHHWYEAPPPVSVSPGDVLDFADIRPDEPRQIQITREQWGLLTLVDGISTLEDITQQMMPPPDTSNFDPQRYAFDLQRKQESVLRIAGELIGEGIAVVRAAGPTSWQQANPEM